MEEQSNKESGRSKVFDGCMGLLVLALIIGGLGWIGSCLCGGNDDPSCTPPRRATPKWYEGGTLHNATAVQWSRASERNRLATAADWAAVALGENRPKSVDDLKPYAWDFMVCVDNATADPALVDASGVTLASLAAQCALLMGY